MKAEEETDESSRVKKVETPTPPNRRIRVFAFDPILSRSIATQEVNEVTVSLSWEEDLGAGPVDDYLEVVDVDPASQRYYVPVDLNEKDVLAQDGLPPSEGNPQFHQQMVYAVARTTIKHFERALGRRALWSARKELVGTRFVGRYEGRLRVYPHALREANAYYSPSKKALLFGYFPASMTDPGGNMPGEIVFTCLSHDIVAHETTHALLDGLHPLFIEPSNIDVWALHEAFADIVALFQHFTYPEVLRHQIAQTRGDLESQNLLGMLAYQFGQAIGRYGALRSAIGHVDRDTGQWVPEKPEPSRILTATEPHIRGAILVAAVFEAYLTIYKWRIRDLLRIATGGTGVLRPGELHPDLVGRLAKEASKTANHILHICIRALDYCPPVDIEFGDYLRALITADMEVVADDRYNYRLAVIEAFRKRGIYPRKVRNLSEESLQWHRPSVDQREKLKTFFGGTEELRKLVPEWTTKSERRDIFANVKQSCRTVEGWLKSERATDVRKIMHLTVTPNAPRSVVRDGDTPRLEVQSVRPARRIGPDGQTVTDLVIEVTQSRLGYFSLKKQQEVESGKKPPVDPDFVLRGGCTLLIDLETGEAKYCVYKRVLSDNRLNRMREYLKMGAAPGLRAGYYGDPAQTYYSKLRPQYKKRRRKEKLRKVLRVEPFAMLHRSYGGEEAR